MFSLIILPIALSAAAADPLSVLIADSPDLAAKWEHVLSGTTPQQEFLDENDVVFFMLSLDNRAYPQVGCYVSASIYSPANWRERRRLYDGLAQLDDVESKALNARTLDSDIVRLLRENLVASLDHRLQHVAQQSEFSLAVGLGAYVAIETPEGKQNVWIVSDNPAASQMSSNDVSSRDRTGAGRQGATDSDKSNARWSSPATGGSWAVTFSNPRLRNDYRMAIASDVLEHLHQSSLEQAERERIAAGRLIAALLRGRPSWDLQAGQFGSTVASLDEEFRSALLRGLSPRGEKAMTAFNMNQLILKGIRYYPILEIKVVDQGNETFYRISIRSWS